MKRRDFIKKSAVAVGALSVSPVMASAMTANNASSVAGTAKASSDEGKETLINSAPVLQNYAETSMGIAFSVTDNANGYVIYGEKADLSDGKKVWCGGYRVTDMNSEVMQIRLTGLKPATKYYYRIGADRIHYGGGYDMKIIETVEMPDIHSFTTAGKKAASHFCVINDTHADWPAMSVVIDKVDELQPACVVWNGDATNVEEKIDSLKEIFLYPDIRRKDFASDMPFIFNPGNHESRGLASRHLEKVWMYRQPEERSSRDWDLGRNFAVRMGDIALIGLDTAEDKLDSNPIFANLFNSEAYREAQTTWLADVLQREEIRTAPFLVTFCHIPLYDDNPRSNPGDVRPNDASPEYDDDYADWQRTCAQLWAPLLEKAHCQLVVSAHTHVYNYFAPTKERPWAHIIGGGHGMDTNDKKGYPTVIEGKVVDGKLLVRIFNARDNVQIGEFTYKRR